MRKYLQITVVLAVFFVLVFLRSLRVEDDEALIVKNDSISPTLVPTSTISPSPAPTDVVVSKSGSTSPPVQAPPTSTPVPQAPKGKYKDGTFTGSVEDAYYGNMQVQVVISGGKIVDVIFLQYPNDNRTSIRINTQAMPIFKEEAIAAQSENVDMVSGASFSSPAFQKSLAAALAQAK